jgi:hypothetical protein
VSKTFVNSKLPCMTLQVGGHATATCHIYLIHLTYGSSDDFHCYQIPRFEIRKSSDGRSHAEFLIVVTFNRLTFGIWRRFSQFKELFRQVVIILSSKLYMHIEYVLIFLNCSFLLRCITSVVPPRKNTNLEILFCRGSA